MEGERFLFWMKAAGFLVGAVVVAYAAERYINSQIDTKIANFESIKKEIAEAAIPPGSVIAFDARDCPAGWKPFEPAEGRTIVGATASGTYYDDKQSSGGSKGDTHGYDGYVDKPPTYSEYPSPKSGTPTTTDISVGQQFNFGEIKPGSIALQYCKKY